MPKIHRSVHVSCSAQQMYDIVNDVVAYPEFLPWCREAKILAQADQVMRAKLSVAKGLLKYDFTTENQLSPGRRIELRLVDGPFKRFHGQWTFEELASGCNVSLVLEFEFSGRILGAALSQMFKPIANSMITAFRQRAHQIYG